jgi:hypothetical protein
MQLSMRKAGLAKPEVTVRAVDAIARHHQTGKITRFIALQHRSSLPPL